VPMDLEVIASSSDRPLPTRNAFSAPFWDAALRHELAIQKCDDCATFRFYPRPMCPQCHSTSSTWTTCSGRGTVYSYTVVRRPLARWFKERMPLVCAVIELEEGVRMISNVVGVSPEDVAIGLAVEVTFEDVNDEFALPMFTVAGSDGAPR
jgi:uncharacterized OB-fold protein